MVQVFPVQAYGLGRTWEAVCVPLESTFKFVVEVEEAAAAQRLQSVPRLGLLREEAFDVCHHLVIVVLGNDALHGRNPLGESPLRM